MKKIKYKYQDEYKNSKDCFWEKTPAKYVKLLSSLHNNNFIGKSILDLGAGEGKNSVFLANLGANIISVDVSEIAISRFNLQPNYYKSHNRIKTLTEDIQNLSFKNECFDIIIAYGILHCLEDRNAIYDMVEKIKSWLKLDGYFVCVTFTNQIAPPTNQEYLNINAFLNDGELQQLFKNWKLINSEDEIITETHPTSNIKHQHSLVRLITQKI